MFNRRESFTIIHVALDLDKMAPLLGLKNVGSMRAFTTKQENQQKELRACPFRRLRTDELRFTRSRRRTERNEGDSTSRI
ncbi:hypothetical protein LBHB_06440 [Leptospira borgpetersenii serovar Hardjo]|nr:hypothetical protein LBHB_06440 [Leptospira borgpetersenii serovar Hardjo]